MVIVIDLGVDEANTMQMKNHGVGSLRGKASKLERY
jgi:hypothetical protein